MLHVRRIPSLFAGAWSAVSSDPQRASRTPPLEAGCNASCSTMPPQLPGGGLPQLRIFLP